MLFASTELAARVERAECGMLAEATRRAAVGGADGACVLPLAGGVATFARPGSPLNKLAGLGFRGPVDESELGAVEREFEGRDAPLQVELACLAEPSIGALLTRRGYVLRGFENVLGRALPGEPLKLPGARAGIEVTSDGAARLPLWIDVVVTGFAAPDTQGVASHESYPREVAERAIADMVSIPSFHLYLAHLGGAAVGAASMRLAPEGVAQLCGAATLPAQRRRGVQSALTAHRLIDAARAGCDLAVITTQPGSKSAENAQRKGFELLYTRAVLVRG
jgi:hypothetical protein